MDRNTPVTRLEREFARELEFHGEIKQLLAHDLRSPASTLDLYIHEIKKTLDELEKDYGSLIPEELKERMFRFKGSLKQMMSAGRRVADMTKILDLSNLTPEEVAQESEEFYPAYKIDEVFKVWTHDAVRRGKGLSLEYRNDDKDKKTITNPGAFSTIFSNLLGNSIQYANKYSNIHAKLTLDQGLTFEIENQISSPIDANELNDLLKRGYRKEGVKKEEYVRNEGLGLYFVNKAVRQGFFGDLKIRSDSKKRINPKTEEDYEKAVYSKEYEHNKEQDSPLFYAKVKLPLKIL
ncbi:HAMP domain-containing histidine kinase [Candidatus Pacearchaeota archaeon]|nr:HAMP domain-containing histidine kinase [Candidatus Pacearchaeota archaeon]